MHTARSHIYTWYGIYIQMVDSMDWEPHLPVSSFPSGSHNQDLLPGLLRSTPVYTDASEMNTTLHCLPAPRRIKIHNSDTVGNVFHHGQVMGNKQISQSHLSLQFDQKIDDLCLNRNIQRRDWLITHNNFGSTASARAIPTRCL